MPAKVILHIGAAKTGSSAVQAFLRRNAQALSDRGYIVLDRFLGLTSDITGEHVWAIQDRVNAGDKAGLIPRLAQAFEMAGADKTLLISAENLSNIGNHLYLAEALREVDARIVLYIRRQDELLTSAWQQWHCKVEGDFNAWLVKGLKTYGHWDRLASDWEGVVGPGNLSIRLFEREAMVDNDLLKDFVATIGLGDQKAMFDYDLGVVNPSFSDVITPLVAGNTRIFEDANDNQFFNFLLKIDEKMFSGGKKASLISRDMRESIVSFYQETNRRVCGKFFPGRPRLFSPIDHSKYNYVEGDELVKMQMQFLLEVAFRSHQYLEKRR